MLVPVAIAALVSSVLPSISARAEEGASPPGLTLEDATARAVAFSPSLKAVDEELSAIRSRAAQTRVWPNPEFEAEFEEFGWDRPWIADVETTFALSQTIPLGDRLDKGAAAIEAESHVARADAAALDLAVRAGVRRAFVLALAAQERLQTATAELGIATRLHSLISQKAEAGQEAPAVLYQAEAGLDLVRLEVFAARTRVEASRAALASHWGGSGKEVHLVAGELVPSKNTGVSDDSPTEAQPEVRRWMAESDAHKARAAAAESEAIPDLTVGGGLRGIDGFEENALVLSIAVPIPVLNRNRDARDEELAMARRARYMAEAELAGMTAEAKRLRIHLNGILERCRLLADEVLPRLESAAGAVEAGVDAGKTGLWDLLLARRRLLETRVRLINLATEYQLALLDYDHLTGKLAGTGRDENETK